MTRAEDIQEIILSGQTEYTDESLSDLHDWLRNCEDAELVEIARGAIAVLAWRVNGGEGDFRPSLEVLVAGIRQVLKWLLESTERDK